MTQPPAGLLPSHCQPWALGMPSVAMPLPCSDPSAQSWTSLILPTPSPGSRALLGPGREAKRPVDCPRHTQGVTSAVRVGGSWPHPRRGKPPETMCTLLIVYPAPYPFPRRLREECLAQGSGLKSGAWGRSQVGGRAILRTCLWELTDCPRT